MAATRGRLGFDQRPAARVPEAAPAAVGLAA